MNEEKKSLEALLLEASEKRDIKKKENRLHTAQDLRTQVLVHGSYMIEKLQKSIYNKDEDLTSQQSQAYDRLWPLLESLIIKTEDLKITNAKTSNDVIKLVSQGKISSKDGKDMMELLKDQSILDELPKLLAKLEEFNK